MSISDNRQEYVFAASSKNPNVLSALAGTYENLANVRVVRKSAAGGGAFMAVSTDGKEIPTFFGWSGDEKSESPEFAHLRIRTYGAAFELESDAFWGYPLYVYRDAETFIASSRLRSVVEGMRKIGVRTELEPNAWFFSLKAHFVTCRLPAIAKTEAFPYGSVARFPTESNVVEFEKKSIPAFRPNGTPVSKTAEEYVTNARSVVARIAETRPNEKIWVLFTGWLDSSALLRILEQGGFSNRTVAVTIACKGMPEDEDELAKETANRLGIERRIVELAPEDAFRLPEAVWNAEDLTDVYGYGISLIRATEANPDLRTILNGWGTDAAIGSTPAILLPIWRAFHWIEPSAIDRNAERRFDPKSAFDGIGIGTYFKSRDFDRKSWMKTISDLSLAGADSFWLERAHFFPESRWETVSAYRDPYGMEDANLRFHDFVTLLDYDGLAHKFADLYKKTWWATDVRMFSPFWSSSLRKTLFDAEVESKFNPSFYRTSVRDNQWFYKKAFWSLVPEPVRNRTKRFWSIPNVRMYMEDGAVRPVMKSVFRRFGSRGVVSIGFLEKIEKIWDFGENARISGKTLKEGEKTVLRSNLSFIWRILVLEVFLQLFIDGKGFEGGSRKLDLRDFV